MGSKCCYSNTPNLSAEEVTCFDKLLLILSEQIRRVLHILEEYVNKAPINYQSVRDIKGFNYYVKLESLLVNLKNIIDDYRLVSKRDSFQTNTDHKDSQHSKLKENLKLNRNLSKRIERLDYIYRDKVIELKQCVTFLIDVFDTEENKNLQKLEMLDYLMLERIFSSTSSVN